MNRFLYAQLGPRRFRLRPKFFSASVQFAQPEVVGIIWLLPLNSRTCVCTFNYFNAYFWSSEFQDSYTSSSVTSFASPRSSKASPLEPEDVPHSAHWYPGESGYITQPPTAYSRSFNGELVAEVPDINPYKYGINFPPQTWQSGRLASFTGSVVISFFHSSNKLRQHQAMPFSRAINAVQRSETSAGRLLSISIIGCGAHVLSARPRGRPRRLPLGSRKNCT